MKGKKAFDIKSFIENTDWQAIESKVVRQGSIEENSVGIYSTKTKKNDDSPYADKINIRLGKEVIKKLDWSKGDQICVMYHPEDLFSFYLAKKDTGKAYTLGLESGNKGINTIGVRWDRKTKIEVFKTKLVNFQIYKNQLVIFSIKDMV